MSPVVAIATTPAIATSGIPPVAKTAIQRTTLWIIREANVAVNGVEYLNPSLTEAFETAKAKAVSRA
jgi:hypothetical protein